MDIKLDYTLKTFVERQQLIEKLLADIPTTQQTPALLSKMSDYLIDVALDKAAKQEHRIITSNRMITINRHETSFQGLADTLESGEDGIYNLMNDGNRRDYITSRVKITDEDVARIPALQETRDSIDRIKSLYESSSGAQKNLYRNWLISLYRDQYAIKNDFKKPSQNSQPTKTPFTLSFLDNITVDAEGNVIDKSTVSLLNPDHVFALLQNYEKLSLAAEARPESDSACILHELENLIDKLFKIDNPIYYTIVQEKIKGQDSQTIQSILKNNFNQSHSIEYISVLWHNKIPAAIAEQATKDYLDWYYTFEARGKWKKCSKCGQIKLAHPFYYSKNKSSKDGYYSICKECRSKIYKQKKEMKK